MTERFTFHEDKLPGVWTAFREEFWSLDEDDDWDPRDDDTDTVIFRLLDDAQGAGVIAGPGTISFTYCGGDDDSYCFHVSLPLTDDKTYPVLRLASLWEEMRRIGKRDTRGINAARAVLEEAVLNANEALKDLDRYVSKVQS